MPDSKITALTSISTSTDPANDPLVIVDVSDTSMAATGTTKKVTLNQLLGASGTATLASATISGDLTVDTNVLKVDTTLNRVGIGTATPSVAADVVGSSAGATLEVLRLQNSGSGVNTKTRLNFYAASTNYGAITGGFGASSPELIFDINTSSGAFIWNNFGSEAMRLNANGLGVGVVPSAWNNTYNVLDLGQNGSISGRTSTNNSVDIVSNGFRNSGGTWVYKLATSNAASRYLIDGATGGHLWYSGAAGTAGNTIAGFSTATMTLDASGRLILLASTTTPATLSTNGQLTFTATSDTNLRFSYRGSDGVTRVANITLA